MTEITSHAQMVAGVEEKGAWERLFNIVLWKQEDMRGGDGPAVTKYSLHMLGYKVKVWINLYWYKHT